MEYGNLWHEAEQAHTGGQPYLPALVRYRDKLLHKYPDETDKVVRAFRICEAQFPVYLSWWSQHRLEVTRKPLMEEVAFKVEVELPSGRLIKLRGKWDCTFQSHNDIWLQENKTKSEVDAIGLQSTVAKNMQTLLYQKALRTLADEVTLYPRRIEEGYYDKNLVPFLKAVRDGGQIVGTMYNVIKRPLSGIFGIKQKKTETPSQFYARLQEDIRTNASEYFYRWLVRISPDMVEEALRKMVYPHLEALCDWWESIQYDPFNPWVTVIDGTVTTNPHHWQTPWGIYNSIAQGLRGDYFETLTTGRTWHLKQAPTLFPELEDA